MQAATISKPGNNQLFYFYKSEVSIMNLSLTGNII